MRQIRDLLATGSFAALAEQLELMARLWDPDRLPGLIQRRRDEARLWRSGFEALQLA
jgi:GH24 family phage-related lysozyme (muramidase)